MKIPGKIKSIASALKERKQVRKALRGPADLYYAIADAVEMLDQDAWQALTAPSGFFMSAAYLKALEKVLPLNLSPRYALVFSGVGEERRPLAAIYMQMADVSLAQLRPEKDRGAKLDELAKSTTQRILTCGNLLTYGQHGIALAPDADPKLAWHGVAEVLYRIRQSEKLEGKTHFIMIKDLHSHHREQAAHLEHLSYRYVETEPNMVLTLNPAWKNYDDYLASLASKYRTNVRNAVFKKMDDGACSIEQLADLAGARDQLHALYKAVQSNAGVRMFELVPDYFAALQAAAGERFRCSVIKRDGALLGFLISVADGDTAVAYHIGFDRAAAEDLPIYLRLLHAGIADAISMGCKEISYGRTALEPKAALGAKPQPFGILVRHRQPVLNKMMKRVLLGIEHEEAPERNPFKKEKAAA
ncbi:GNAT family N-acetyltransferase [Massilia sp. CF038]|uniref:GNAT family N-acetyltransferase n=1 Tax=Massilia sp. CF038 TaxID=1881045 RepID=UPI00091A6D64|nr:GNAT family N-acetyltransferase [Massilia sp. CF038]SHG98314.1 Acetyltransferase (GNAT) domain-containing protein [Massilia sp. CF038]